MAEPWEVYGGAAPQEPWEVYGAAPPAKPPQQQQPQQLSADQLVIAGNRRLAGDQPKDLTWSEVGAQAWQNAPASAYQFGADLLQPILHPIDTLTNIGDAGHGLAQKLGVAPGTDDIEKADAVGQFFKDRYYGVENIKRTLATDPVGVVGDLSALLTGGETVAARAPGVVGRAARAAGTVGRAIDPLTYAVKAPASLATWMAERGLGMTTGVGPDAVRTARLAGREGGEASAALRDQMRGNAPLEEIVSDAHAAAGAMRQRAQASYRQDMRAVGRDKTILSWNDVDTALNDIAQVGTFKGRSISKSADAVRTAIIKEIDDWKNLKASDYWTPEGFDALKKSINDIGNKIPFENKAARSIVKQAADAVKATIVKQAPVYADTMRNYHNYAERLDEIQRTLSLRPGATVDTALRKLTSVMRNNVNTTFGQRAKLVQQLQDAGAPALREKIAGASLNAWTPRGLANLSPALGIPAAFASAFAGGSLAPLAALPALALTSPRAVGETARGLGTLQRYAGRAGPLFAPAARQTGLYFDNSNQ